MQRSKRILLVSHCILNQNTVIENEARAEGAIISATEWAMKEGFGILQLSLPRVYFSRVESTVHDIRGVQYSRIQETLQGNPYPCPKPS